MFKQTGRPVTCKQICLTSNTMSKRISIKAMNTEPLERQVSPPLTPQIFTKSLCSPWYPKLVGLQEGTLDSHRFSRRASYRERGCIQRGKMQTGIQKQSCTRNSVSVPARSTRACHFPGCPERMGENVDLHTGMSADTKFYLHTKDKWPQSSWKFHSLLTSCMSTRDNERERWGERQEWERGTRQRQREKAMGRV